MNTLSYYIRQKEDWGHHELEQLKSEYVEQELTISHIGDIHKRTPGAISYRLQRIGIIEKNTTARGYDNYKNSKLYNEIVSCERKERIEKVKPKLVVPVSHLNEQPKEFLELKIQYLEMRNELTILKNDVKEILRLMNAVYTFET